jgi:transposase
VDRRPGPPRPDRHETDVEEHHRFLVSMQLRWLEAAEQDIEALDLRIAERLEPYSLQHALLTQIPGVDWVVAAALMAEIGVDMSVFLSVHHHLVAGAGVRPGNHESAGKQKSGRSRKGNVHLRTMLVGAAISASRTKGSYLKDKFYRLKAGRGALRARPRHRPQILLAADLPGEQLVPPDCMQDPPCNFADLAFRPNIALSVCCGKVRRKARAAGHRRSWSSTPERKMPGPCSRR